MLVMPSNNSNAHKLSEMYPGLIGQLMGPGGWRDPKGLPFALDNGKFPCWASKKDWVESKFIKLLDVSAAHEPLWVVVPDTVTDATATFESWNEWAPRLSGFKLALAVQDGMTPDSVRRHTDPDVIFVGGSTNWKRETAWNWCHEFPRVHVGRVNTERWLWHSLKSGAESCDGTGWFRGDQKQLAGLHRFLRRHSSGVGREQMELEFARTFVRKGHVPAVSFITGGRNDQGNAKSN